MKRWLRKKGPTRTAPEFPEVPMYGNFTEELLKREWQELRRNGHGR